jgi:hypothetical protein
MFFGRFFSGGNRDVKDVLMYHVCNEIHRAGICFIGLPRNTFRTDRCSFIKASRCGTVDFWVVTCRPVGGYHLRVQAVGFAAAFGICPQYTDLTTQGTAVHTCSSLKTSKRLSDGITFIVTV